MLRRGNWQIPTLGALASARIWCAARKHNHFWAALRCSLRAARLLLSCLRRGVRAGRSHVQLRPPVVLRATVVRRTAILWTAILWTAILLRTTVCGWSAIL